MARVKNRLYIPWVEMRRRARRSGSAVAPRWDDFYKFVIDMSPRPAGTELALVNPSVGYVLGNCYWKLRAPRIMVGDVSLPACQWARRLGFDRRLIRDRIVSGMSPEEAVVRPLDPHGRFIDDSIFRIRTTGSDGKDKLSIPWATFAEVLEVWRARRDAALAAGVKWEIIRETPRGKPVLVMG